MQDRGVEATAPGERGVGVQRVAVTGEPVEQRLAGRGGVADDVVGRGLGHRRRPGRPARAAEAALTADEHGLDGGGERLPGGGVDRLGLGAHQRAAALVEDPGDGGRGGGATLHRQGCVQPEALLGVHQQGRVEVTERDAGTARDDVRVGGQHRGAHSVGVVGGEGQLPQGIVVACAHRERVEQNVVDGPAELDRLTRRAEQTLRQRHAGEVRTARAAPHALPVPPSAR